MKKLALILFMGTLVSFYADAVQCEIPPFEPEQGLRPASA